MELLVAYQKDPAGHNIAKFISQEMEKMVMFTMANILIWQ